MALSNTEKVRIELQDTEIGQYLLSDDEIEYFLEKNSNSVPQTSIDCARAILLKLSMRGNETVDIFSIQGAKAAAEYRESLKLYLSNPYLNPVLKSIQGWVGGVSKEDIQDNLDIEDNNVVTPPNKINWVSVTPKYF